MGLRFPGFIASAEDAKLAPRRCRFDGPVAARSGTGAGGLLGTSRRDSSTPSSCKQTVPAPNSRIVEGSPAPVVRRVRSSAATGFVGFWRKW